MGTKSGLLSRWMERNDVRVLIVLDNLVSADVDFIIIGVRKTSLLGSLDMALESTLRGMYPSMFSLGRPF